MKSATLALAVVLFAMLSPLSQAQGTRFRVVGIAGETLLEESLNARPGDSLGQLSDQILKNASSRHELKQYDGSDAGVISINGLGSATEVLSESHQVRVYGWCYRVDGKTPQDLAANQYLLTGHEIRIEWFYGYAQGGSDGWESMCVPADHPPAQSASPNSE